MRNRFARWLFFAVTLLSVSCADAAPAGEAPPTGQILLWHDWQEKEAQTLNDLIDIFTEINPDVDVLAQQVNPETMVQRFEDRTASGLGPDILLLDAGLAFELVQGGLINDISGQVDIEEGQYLAAGLAPLQDGERLYGLPFSMHTQVLFYNKELVETPPRSLEELQDRVGEGEKIALNTNLTNALWGLGSFGGTLFDTDGGLTIAQGGLTNWLDFLQQAQAMPGFFLDIYNDRLQESFIQGETAYYVGPSTETLTLQTALGEQALASELSAENAENEGEANGAAADGAAAAGAGILGVAPLPAGPNEWRSSPLLQVDALVFSPASSSQERELALLLTDFLTNPQQQARLAAEGIGRVPANAQVQLNRNLPESTIALANQSRTATPIPFASRAIWNQISNEGSDFALGFTQTLQGLLPADRFVQEAAQQMSEELGVEIVEPDAVELCPTQGGGEATTLTVWHSLPEAEASVLEATGEAFASLCSNVTFDMMAMDADGIIEQYVGEAQAGSGPDILFESSRWTSQLAEQGLLHELTDYVRPEDLEPLIPGAASAMRYEGQPFGIPESVSVLALLYNRELVENPPASLEELLYQVDPDRRWALPMRFYYGYWGLNPFGGFEFNSEEGTIEEADGLVPWLTWLQDNQHQPGVDLTFDPEEATAAFANGEAAYLVGGPWILPQLREMLDDESIGVTTLPGGPLGPGTPILQVRGTMVNANSSSSAVEGAVGFARYLNLPENQALFLDTGAHISASVTLSLEEYPLLNGFHDQAKLAAVVDENGNFAAMEELGDQLYEDVLLDERDPGEAVVAFLSAVEALPADE